MADGRLRRAKLAFERNFTQVPNEWLRDPNLSLKARGLLGMLMSHDEGYIVTQEQLAKMGPDGRSAIESAIKELKEHGYLDISKRRDLGGRISGYVWELTDPVEVKKSRSQPLAGFPGTDNPYPEKPWHGKPASIRTTTQEHLTKELKTGDGTRAGINEDASGDSHQDAAESADERYLRLLHQPCEFRAGKEHDYTPDRPCSGCGLRAGQYFDRGEVRYLSDLMSVEVSA